MSRILVDEDPATWEKLQKRIPCGLIAPFKKKVLGCSQRGWISSQIAGTGVMHPGFQQEDILSTLNALHSTLEIASGVHDVCSPPRKHDAADNLRCDCEVPKPTRYR